MFEQQSENIRVNLRGDHAEEMRPKIIAAVGIRQFMIWQLRAVDRWPAHQIAAALTIHRRTVEKSVRRVQIAAEQIAAEQIAEVSEGVSSKFL